MRAVLASVVALLVLLGQAVGSAAAIDCAACTGCDPAPVVQACDDGCGDGHPAAPAEGGGDDCTCSWCLPGQAPAALLADAPAVASAPPADLPRPVVIAVLATPRALMPGVPRPDRPPGAPPGARRTTVLLI